MNLELLGQIEAGRDADHGIFFQIVRILDEALLSDLDAFIQPMTALTHGIEHGILLQVFPKKTPLQDAQAYLIAVGPPPPVGQQ